MNRTISNKSFAVIYLAKLPSFTIIFINYLCDTVSRFMSRLTPVSVFKEQCLNDRYNEFRSSDKAKLKRLTRVKSRNRTIDLHQNEAVRLPPSPHLSFGISGVVQ